MKSASKRETAKITITTTGKGHQNFPVSPGISKRGIKAIIVVAILKITGRETSLVPAIAASIGLSPFLRYSYTFSPTTMASSTTIPSTTRNPNMEIMLILTPTSGRKMIPPIKEIVIPIMTQKARRYSRNRVKMIRTMTMAINPFSVSRERRSL